MVFPARWKPWVYILVFGAIFLTFFLIYAFEPPRVEWGDTVKIEYYTYDSKGDLIGHSPAGGHTFVLLDGSVREPTALFGSVYHRHAGEHYIIEVDACLGQDCADYGGPTHGDYAWQYQKYDITILEIVTS